MTVEFLDMEDKSNPLSGIKIREKGALLRVLDGFRNRKPFICELVGENGFRLLLGLGGVIGCVQHSPNDGNTPYLMAVDRGQHDTNAGNMGHVDFLAGGTPTPISTRYLIPIELLREIAIEFLRTGKLSSSVIWEQI